VADDQYLIEIRSDISDMQRDMRTLQRETRRLSEQMDRRFRQSSQRISANFSSAFAVAARGATALGVAVAAGVALSVRESARAEEIRSRFNAVFRGISDETRQWAQETATAVNRSSIALEEYLSTFQDTFVPLGASREAAAAMSQQLTTLAIDLASFKNESEPETVAALQSAIVGNTETVRRYGVIINEARLEQELLNMGFAGGKEEAGELAAAQARLNMIIRGTTDAQGDGIRTANSATNQFRSLMAQFQEVGTAIGEDFMPAAQQMMRWLEEILPTVQSFGEAMGEIASDMAAVFEASRDGEIIAARDVEHANRLLEDVRELQQLLLNMPAGAMLGSTNVSSLRRVLGAENLEREGLTLGAQSRLSASEIQSMLAMTTMRIDELQAQRVVLSGGGGGAGDGGSGGSSEGDGPTEPAKDIEELRRQWETISPSVNEVEEAVKRTAEELKDMSAEAIEEAKDGFDDLGEHGVQAARAFENAFVRAIETGRFEVEDLGRQILRIFAQIAYQETFEGPIRGLIRSAFNLGGGGGGIGKKASGGPGSGLTLVGEQGPELVNLGDHANVMTANLTRMAMRNATAGGGVNSNSVSQSFVIDARGADMGVEERLRQVLAEQAPLMQQRATVGALEAMNAIQKRQRAV